MVVDTSGLYLDPNMFAPKLSESEKALRECFVTEYVKDFDPLLACLRIGFQAAFAVEYAKRLMEDPYVNQRISELTLAQPSNAEQQAQQDKALVMSVLRQAAQNGPYASRVQAASKLATIMGLDKPTGDNSEEETLIEAFKNFAAKVPV